MSNDEIASLETKIKHAQALINSYRQELNNYEQTLSALTQQLLVIKSTMNNPHQNISPVDSKPNITH